LTNDSTPTIEGVAEAGSTVNLYNNTQSGTYLVTVESKTSEHTYEGTGSSLGYKIDGVFSPFLTFTPGNTYRFDQSDSSNTNHPLRFYLDAGKSTLYDTDVITNGTPGQTGAYTEITISDATPSELHFQCASHGYMGDAAYTSLGSTTADETTGAYTITPAALSDGDYSLKVTATDTSGNTSAASDALPITVDATEPAQPAITTTTTLTNDATLTIAGTAEAGSTVTLLNGEVALGTTTANGEGQFSITTSTLADSNYVLTVTATDAAGNISAASSALNITVDTTAPSAPSITTTTTLTNDATPTIEGIAEAGSTVELFNGDVSLGTTTADGTTGAYTISPT
jgi:chitodextrinase